MVVFDLQRTSSDLKCLIVCTNYVIKTEESAFFLLVPIGTMLFRCFVFERLVTTQYI